MDREQFIKDFCDADVSWYSINSNIFSYITSSDLELLPGQNKIGLEWLDNNYIANIVNHIDYVASYHVGHGEWLALLKLTNGYWMWFCATSGHHSNEIGWFFIHENIDTLIRFGIDEKHRRLLHLDIFMSNA